MKIFIVLAITACLLVPVVVVAPAPPRPTPAQTYQVWFTRYEGDGNTPSYVANFTQVLNYPRQEGAQKSTTVGYRGGEIRLWAKQSGNIEYTYRGTGQVGPGGNCDCSIRHTVPKLIDFSWVPDGFTYVKNSCTDHSNRVGTQYWTKVAGPNTQYTCLGSDGFPLEKGGTNAETNSFLYDLFTATSKDVPDQDMFIIPSVCEFIQCQG
jgi:hypothetical protein